MAVIRALATSFSAIRREPGRETMKKPGVRQCGDFIANVGEPFLIDGRRRLRLNHPVPMNMLALTVPYSALSSHAPAVDGLVAHHLPRRASLQLLAAQMQTLNSWPHELHADESCLISDLLVSTLQVVLLHETADESTSAWMRRCFFRRQVQQIIEQQYADPSLFHAAVAHQLGGLCEPRLRAWRKTAPVCRTDGVQALARAYDALWDFAEICRHHGNRSSMRLQFCRSLFEALPAVAVARCRPAPGARS